MLLSIFLSFSALLFCSGAQSVPCEMRPGVQKSDDGCAYTFLMPIPDDGECFDVTQAASTISPDGRDISTLVKRLQSHAKKIDTFKRITMQHMWRIDDLEAAKNEVQRQKTIQGERINEIEADNTRLLSELNSQSQEIRSLVAELLELRTAARENATKLAELQNQLRQCRTKQGDDNDIHDFDPMETELAFDGTSSMTYFDASNPIPLLTEMTWCLWMKTPLGLTNEDRMVISHYESPYSSQATSRSTSYAVTFFMDQIWDYRLRGGGGVSLFGRVPRDGHWHHVCMAWVGRIGKGRRWLYIDGTGTILGDGHVEELLGGGTMYLGYFPDMDHRVSTVKFIGAMALFNMWDRKLDTDEIARFAKQCTDTSNGNLFSWSAMLGDHATRENIIEGRKDYCGNEECSQEACMTDGPCIYTSVEQCSCPSNVPCHSEGRKLHFDGSSVIDINVNDKVTHIGALTVCLWLKTTTTRGTLFRITTSESNSRDAIRQIDFRDFSLSVQTYGDTHHNWYSYLGIDPAKVTDNQWHHVCLVGNFGGSRATAFRIYKDGMMITRPYFRQSLSMHGLKTVTLGGATDSRGSTAEIYGFQFWDRDLSGEESQIYTMSRKCGEYFTEDAFVPWSTFSDAAEQSAVTISPSDICL